MVCGCWSPCHHTEVRRGASPYGCCAGSCGTRWPSEDRLQVSEPRCGLQGMVLPVLVGQAQQHGGGGVPRPPTFLEGAERCVRPAGGLHGGINRNRRINAPRDSWSECVAPEGGSSMGEIIGQRRGGAGGGPRAASERCTGGRAHLAQWPATKFGRRHAGGGVARRVSYGLPPFHSEAAQIVRCRLGEEYHEHCDWFDHTGPHYAAKAALGGGMLVSVFCYLQECARGGETAFNRLGMKLLHAAGTWWCGTTSVVPARTRGRYTAAALPSRGRSGA